MENFITWLNERPWSRPESRWRPNLLRSMFSICTMNRTEEQPYLPVKAIATTQCEIHGLGCVCCTRCKFNDPSPFLDLFDYSSRYSCSLSRSASYKGLIFFSIKTTNIQCTMPNVGVCGAHGVWIKSLGCIQCLSSKLKEYLIYNRLSDFSTARRLSSLRRDSGAGKVNAMRLPSTIV